MSNIVYSTINTSFPVAGQDNNSQGFRDNFTNISSALAVAKTEISALQTNALLSADLSTNTTVVNNLNGSSISNGIYLQFNGQVQLLGSVGSGGANVNVANGPMQTATLTASAALTFTGWPAAGQYSVVKLMLLGDQSAKRVVTLTTTNSGHIKVATTPSLSTVAITGTAGQFSCDPASLYIGQLINLSGSFTGSGSITGYSSPIGSYYVIATNGSTTFTLSATKGGSAITTTAGSTTGLTFTLSTIVSAGNSAAYVTLDQINHYAVLEAWSIDGGATVYVRGAGEFSSV